MGALTLAWRAAEGKGSCQHDVWRSRNVGDFSPVGEGKEIVTASSTKPQFPQHLLIYVAKLLKACLPGRATSRRVNKNTLISFSLSLSLSSKINPGHQ